MLLVKFDDHQETGAIDLCESKKLAMELNVRWVWRIQKRYRLKMLFECKSRSAGVQSFKLQQRQLQELKAVPLEKFN